MDVQWGRKGNWLYFSSLDNGRRGIAPFRQFSPEYDDFSLFFQRYRKANPPLNGNMDEDYLRKGLAFFIDYQKKQRAALSAKLKLERECLPIFKFKDEIHQLVKKNKVILIAADTGAGKSTQVPQYLMEAGFDKIAVTQPRRIACYSLAKRVANECLSYGSSSKIAYQVRFDGSKTENTRILFLTEGILLKQFELDPYLGLYNVIIVDEVHERHISCDFLLGILKKVLENRNDLRVVMMSATIQAKLFSTYFHDAPIIQVPGRMFPVSITYIPLDEKDRNLTDAKLIEARRKQEIKQSIVSKPVKIKTGPYLKILERIDEEVPKTERGDVLIFVSGMNEISTLSESLKDYSIQNRRWIILSLHSSLSVADQEKVFHVAPEGVRKCIISTNIAETSVTIDGIRWVLDSGKVKELAYDSSLGISKLKEYWISQSSAKQRCGRAGRTGPGECYRFYSKEEFDNLNEFPVPEIQRINLDSIVLQGFSLGLGSPFEFDFLERPPDESLEHSISNLVDLGCLGPVENQVTELGRVLALMPIDIVLGKMLILGSITSLLRPVLAIAALLSIQSPFSRVAEGSHSIMTNRKSIFSNHGDPFTLLALFTKWLDFKNQNKGYGKSKKFCHSFGVEEQRLYEAVKLKEQFDRILQSQNLANLDASLSSVPQENDLGIKREKRMQKRLLEKRKLANQGNFRKLLKLEDGFAKDEEEDGHGDSGAIPEIDELEFLLKSNPELLLLDSDVSSLSMRELTIVKLVMCSGLYPNLAIPDENNYSRPASEQVFHTKSQRFISLMPDSVFAFNPEILHGVPFEEQQVVANVTSTSLKDMHQKRIHKDLLCYVSLLETQKPYLTNVTRLGALEAVLLFSKNVLISADLLHLVADEWLHIEFFDTNSAQRVLEFGPSLRYMWDSVIQDKLPKYNSEFDGNEEEIAGQLSGKYKLDHIPYIPECVGSLRRTWYELLIKGKRDNKSDHTKVKDEEVVDKIIDLVELDVIYSVEKLKKTASSSSFLTKSIPVEVTPHFSYLLPTNIHPNAKDARALKLPSIAATHRSEPTSTDAIEKLKSDNNQRSLFECPHCWKSLFLLKSEIESHLLACCD